MTFAIKYAHHLSSSDKSVFSAEAAIAPLLEEDGPCCASLSIRVNSLLGSIAL